jgi:hypothetical protein
LGKNFLRKFFNTNTLEPDGIKKTAWSLSQTRRRIPFFREKIKAFDDYPTQLIQVNEGSKLKAIATGAASS